jgi:hypothetical protein
MWAGESEMQNLDEMTNLEKIQAMEQLWESLTQNQQIPTSPSWHAVELTSRIAKIREGKTGYTDLDQLKERGAIK